MKLVISVIFLVILTVVVSVPAPSLKDAPSCRIDQCRIPYCQCYNTKPTLALNQIPQIVVISTDDAVTAGNYEALYKSLYSGRKNPNGCQIGVTFFVPHEYTDYSVVHALYAAGFEIGVNSISKYHDVEYWNTADHNLLKDEFLGQKQILEKFAKVNQDVIRGARTPLLQMNGDLTFWAYQNSSLVYDNSWTTVKETEWPYTLDYKSEQDCLIGKCPKESHKGFWILPINDWIDTKGYPCATIHGCIYKPNDTVEATFNWLKDNFDRVYYGEKIPFNIIANAGLFTSNFRAAYIKFLDYIQSFRDVYIVTQNHAIRWATNPLPIGNVNLFPCDPVYDHDNGKSRTCKLKKGGEDRYMTIYDEVCPRVYPWVGNPMGN